MSIEPQIRVSAVCERDLDLLLLEEIVANPAFREKFISAAGVPTSKSPTILDASRSITQSNGESDLEITLGETDEGTTKLLVENKISAGFQNQQAARYRERAAAYVQNG